MFFYNDLWKQLSEKGYSPSEMRKWNISPNTIQSMKEGKFVSLDVINKICNHLNCNPEDILTYIPDEVYEDFELALDLVESELKYAIDNKKILDLSENVPSYIVNNISEILRMLKEGMKVEDIAFYILSDDNIQ